MYRTVIGLDKVDEIGNLSDEQMSNRCRMTFEAFI